MLKGFLISNASLEKLRFSMFESLEEARERALKRGKQSSILTNRLARTFASNFVFFQRNTFAHYKQTCFEVSGEENNCALVQHRKLVAQRIIYPA